jgi:hypothetical protein
MAEDPAHQPHDKLFKLGFGEPSRAAAFLRAHVPPQLKGLVRARQADVVDALEVRFGLLPEGLIGAIHSISDGEKLRELLRHAIRRADLESFSHKL